MSKILVTGANGFIGQSLCKTIGEKNKLVRGIVRNKLPYNINDNIEYFSIGDINFETDWMHLLSDVDFTIADNPRAWHKPFMPFQKHFGEWKKHSKYLKPRTWHWLEEMITNGADLGIIGNVKPNQAADVDAP